jgi:hypothetical protein
LQVAASGISPKTLVTNPKTLQVAASGKHKDDGTPADDNTELLESLTNADVVTFVKGDKVKVLGGDLVGLFGYVHAVREDGIIEVMSQLEEMSEPLALLPSQIVKTVEVPGPRPRPPPTS